MLADLEARLARNSLIAGNGQGGETASSIALRRIRTLVVPPRAASATSPPLTQEGSAFGPPAPPGAWLDGDAEDATQAVPRPAPPVVVPPAAPGTVEDEAKPGCDRDGVSCESDTSESSTETTSI